MRARTLIYRAALPLALFVLGGVARFDAQGPAPGPVKQASTRALGNKLTAIDPATEQQKQALGRSANGANTLNAFKTCLNNLELCQPWMTFTGVVGRSLPIHDRELIILRTAWLCGNDYTWGIHVDIARQNGFTAADILRITEGPNSKGWSAWDAALLAAADGLYADKLIPDATWTTLDEKYSDAQLMDAIFTAGQYSMISMFVRSAGIQPETGRSGFPSPRQ